MSGVRVTFSPFTAEPGFLREMTAVVLMGQAAAWQAVWAAQWHAAHAVALAALQAQCAVLDAATRRG